MGVTSLGGIVHLDRRPLKPGFKVSADARIDNRRQLYRELGFMPEIPPSDDDLVLAAYGRWGGRVPGQILGAFAFSVWDERRGFLFCARDPLGIRPFYYYHDPGRVFVFGSDPAALFQHHQVPFGLNHARIADFLVPQLEGIDKTSTFFDGIQRLPPGHSLTVGSKGLVTRRFWAPEGVPELSLPNDEAYDEAFLAVFTDAVESRVSDGTAVASMLSGGMDSGSVVAVARELFAEGGLGPLPTFSALGSRPDSCPETAAIRAAANMEGLDVHTLLPGHLEDLLPEISEQTWNVAEPFDWHMTLPRAMYILAARHGVRQVLDGIDGDVLLAEGRQIGRLMRSGYWLWAYREAQGRRRFWGKGYPAAQDLLAGMGQALLPEAVLAARRNGSLKVGGDRAWKETLASSLIHRDFAKAADVRARLEALASQSRAVPLMDASSERALALDHPYLTVGIERYHRVATAAGVEPLHPFLDLRLVNFFLSLPDRQRAHGGWPKIILRRAMAGRLPDEVRWRRGKHHLGGVYNRALFHSIKEEYRVALAEEMDVLTPYISADALHLAHSEVFEKNDPSHLVQVQDAACLAFWLRRHQRRPTIENGRERLQSPVMVEEGTARNKRNETT